MDCFFKNGFPGVHSYSQRNILLLLVMYGLTLRRREFMQVKEINLVCAIYREHTLSNINEIVNLIPRVLRFIISECHHDESKVFIHFTLILQDD